MPTLLTLAAASVLSPHPLHAQGLDTASEWQVNAGGNGHWYAHVVIPYPLGTELCGIDWAIDHSESVGAYPATLTSAEEEAFVQGILPYFNGAYSTAFLGGRRDSPKSDWYWVTGEPFEYSNFIGGVSVGQNIHLYDEESTFGPGWRRGYDCFAVEDVTVDEGVSVILEWSADCNGDGLVDYGQILAGDIDDADGNGVPDCCDAGDPCPESSGDSIQWRVEDGGNGHWYAVVFEGEQITFQDARTEAQAIGGDLAILDGEPVNTWVFSNLVNNPDIWVSEAGGLRHGPWIGLVQDTTAPDFDEPAGGWYWLDGSALDYDNWASSNNVCEDMPAEFLCGGRTGLLDFGCFYCPYEADDSCPDPVDTWGSVPFDRHLQESYLIEWSADCNGDGIVDHGQILDGTFEDLDRNGVPDCCDAGESCGSVCPADLSGDGLVGPIDLGLLLTFWGTDGQNNPQADIDGDGLVNAIDLGLVLSGWGVCPEG